jgi:hypothetical protein
MPQLLDRDRIETSERPANRRRIPRKLIAVVIGIAVLVPVTTQFADVLPHWSNPFKQQIVDRSPTPLLLTLQNLSQYHAATGTFQVVVDVEHDTVHIPALISGERTTFLGIGSVDAVVDFTNVGPHHVTVSRVVGRERGLVNRIAAVFQDSPTGEQEVYQFAQARMNEAATASDLARRGQENTRQMLTTLGSSLGFSNVTVVFETV